MAGPQLRDVGMFTVAADDAALQGHFPGDPIVPGVVVLERALEPLLQTLAAGAAVAAIPRLKFIGVVRPGEPVSVAGARQGARLRLRCTVAGQAVADGHVEIAE